jgi:predicted phosphodiesterase
MWRRKKEYKKRGGNPLFAIFRMGLSLIILSVLSLGVYSAYRQFSGVDPIKMNPKALVSNFTSTDKLIDLGLSLLKFDPKKVAGVVSGAKVAEIPADNSQPDASSTPKTKPHSALSFKFALVTDSHNENDYLKKALDQSKQAGAKLVIGLGDYTEVGTVAELSDAKKEFDATGLRYFLTPGDHDLWDSRDKGHDPKTNFVQVYGRTYQAFSYGQVRFIILDNSDNYKGVDAAQMDFLKEELSKAKNDSEIQSILVFLHEPLYHPSSDRVMGKVSPDLAKQSKAIIDMLKVSDVKGVFAGDIHYFTSYTDPENNLAMTTIGAVASQRNAQNPRFGMVSVYDDGSWSVDDVEIK